jgi:hypothetical protein
MLEVVEKNFLHAEINIAQKIDITIVVLPVN